MNSLLYRRQFVLGNKFIDEFENWNKLKIDNDLFLTRHPDLEITHLSTENITIVGLGIFIDPFNPNYSNKQILNSLLTDTSKDCINKTYSIGGRWAIIYINKEKNESVIFNDTVGDRQIYYTSINNNCWCASQPHVLAEILGIQLREDENLKKFIFAKNFELMEHCWIGNKTLYQNIFHLLPNHYLNINNINPFRFFPSIDDLKNTDSTLDNTIKKVSEILKGTIESLVNRNQITMAVTAGLDSRTILAASKNFKDKIYYFISTHPGLNENETDVTIPKKLFNNLKIPFHILNGKNINPNNEIFLKYFFKNVAQVTTKRNIGIYYNYFEKFEGKILVGGGSGEISRNYYGLTDKNLTPEFLSKLFGRFNDKYTILEIEEWFSNIKDLIPFLSNEHINLLDLFVWEHKAGNWQTMGPAEEDICLDGVRPLSNRSLIISLLSVNKKPEINDSQYIQKEIIKYLWPELLTEPINPFPLYKNIVKKALKYIGLLDTFRKIKIVLRLF